MLQRVKGTVLLTSHDMQEIGEMSESISVLNAGHSVINNINQFQLREKYNSYSITLYKGKSLVKSEDFNDLQ